jgi:hypothetical protein
VKSSISILSVTLKMEPAGQTQSPHSGFAENALRLFALDERIWNLSGARSSPYLQVASQKVGSLRNIPF